jgi:hypothetical protein
MSNSSSAGDSLGISIGRNPTTGSSICVSGWFDIKHWCAETGVTTDHSGPNSITQDGFDRMLEGICNTGTAVAQGPHLLLSSSTTAVTAGTVGTLRSASPGFGTPTDGVAVGTGTTEMWTQTGTTSVFAGAALSGSTTRTQAGNELVLVCDTASTDIGTIQVVDRNTGTPGSSVVLAQRSSGSTGTGNLMSLIQMNATDTLTITYSISVTS